MLFLYNLSILFYGLAIRVASLYSTKARLWISGRKGLFHQLENSLATNNKPLIWIHCASVGEFEQGRPLIEQLRRQHPQYKLLLTFFSPSGFELRKNYSGADYVYYLPLDTLKNAQRFLDIVSPKLVVFVKYEYWLNYLAECKTRGIPHIMVSAIFRPSQIFFKSYGSLFLKALRGFNQLFVQDEQSRQLLNRYSINQVTVAGDTRFDRVLEVSVQNTEIPFISNFISGHRCFIAGSTWPDDEKIIQQAIHSINDLKCVIVPHEIDTEHIQEILRLFPDSIAYTRVKNESDLNEKQTLVLDKIGLLSSLYRYADLVYVGGGFGKGIHNVLEAAVYGKPVIFGPRYQKFKESVDLLKLGGAVTINNQSDLTHILKLLLEHENTRLNKGLISKKYVEESGGATEKILKEVYAFL